MSRRSTLCLLIVISLTGCATTELLSPKAKEIKIVNQVTMAGCKPLGIASGSGKMIRDFSPAIGARNRMLKQAGAMGGNAIGPIQCETC